MSAIVKALVYKYPHVYKFKIRQIWAWLDDFIMSGSGESVSIAMNRTTRMLGLFFAIVFKLGVIVSLPKTIPALQDTDVLGVRMNTRRGTLALKQGKAADYLKEIENLLNSSILTHKACSKVCGQLNWVTYVLPPIKALCQPYIAAAVIAEGSDVLCNQYPALWKEVQRVSAILTKILSTDPQVNIHEFFAPKLKTEYALYSDASG